jgi:hypothetical protein
MMMSPADLNLLQTLHEDRRCRLTRRVVTDVRSGRPRRRLWKD